MSVFKNIEICRTDNGLILVWGGEDFIYEPKKIGITRFGSFMNFWWIKTEWDVSVNYFSKIGKRKKHGLDLIWVAQELVGPAQMCCRVGRGKRKNGWQWGPPIREKKWRGTRPLDLCWSDGWGVSSSSTLCMHAGNPREARYDAEAHREELAADGEGPSGWRRVEAIQQRVRRLLLLQ
jgi:hypothetical protein